MQLGFLQELQIVVIWLCVQLYFVKIVVVGNYDLFFDEFYIGDCGDNFNVGKVVGKMINWGDIIYFENSEMIVICVNGC